MEQWLFFISTLIISRSGHAFQTDCIYQLAGLRIETVDAVIGFGEDGGIQVETGAELLVRMFGCDLNQVDSIRVTQNDTDCDDEVLKFTDIDGMEKKKDSISFKIKIEEETTYYFCIRNRPRSLRVLQHLGDNGTAADIPWEHQTNEGWKTLHVQHRVKEYYFPMPVQIIAVVLLLCLSGLFSGLNLGLMALDKTELEIVMKVGDKKEKNYASKIYPVRKTGNYLLCSLLFGNVIVNSAISILFDDLTSGMIALVGSSFGIVVFGEIIPQSVCSRYGLAVGASTIYLTRFFMIVTAPLSWPISKILDCILGDEVGTVYNRDRLLELIRVSQGSDLGLKNCTEVQIVSGALQLSNKTAADVMTHIQDVFMVPADAILDTKTVSDIVQSGFTRIPVYEGEKPPDIKIVGLLNVKDLALLDPDDNLPIQTICQFYNHAIRMIMEDMPLNVMLEEFKKGDSHLAFVERVNESGEGDPVYEVVGVVTLEDIIEEIIQAEIVDETDMVSDNRKKIPRRVQKDFNLLVDGSLDTGVAHISPQLALACFQHLVASFEEFRGISDKVLQSVIRQNVVVIEPDEKKSPILLFEKGRPSDMFVLILEGHAEAIIGEGDHLFEAGPFKEFGKEMLYNVNERAPKGSLVSKQEMKAAVKAASFLPDFTLRVTHSLTYLGIRAATYMEAHRATFIQTTKGVDPDKVAAMINQLQALPPAPRKGSHPSMGSLGVLADFNDPDGSPNLRRERPPSSNSLKAISRDVKRRFSTGADANRKINQAKKRCGAGVVAGGGTDSSLGSTGSAVAHAIRTRKRSDSKGSSLGLVDAEDGSNRYSMGMTTSESSLGGGGADAEDFSPSRLVANGGPRSRTSSANDNLDHPPTPKYSPSNLASPKTVSVPSPLSKVAPIAASEVFPAASLDADLGGAAMDSARLESPYFPLTSVPDDNGGAPAAAVIPSEVGLLVDGNSVILTGGTPGPKTSPRESSQSDVSNGPQRIPQQGSKFSSHKNSNSDFLTPRSDVSDGMVIIGEENEAKLERKSLVTAVNPDREPEGSETTPL